MFPLLQVVGSVEAPTRPVTILLPSQALRNNVFAILLSSPTLRAQVSVMAKRGFYPEDVLCLALSMNCDRETPHISFTAALCRWR